MRITPKILLAASVATISVLGVTDALTWTIDRQNAYHDLQARGHLIVQRLAPTTARALYNLDEAIGKDTLLGEACDPDIACIIVFDGAPPAAAAAGAPPAAPRKVFAGIETDDQHTIKPCSAPLTRPDLLTLSGPATLDGKVLGEIVVQIKTSAVQQRLWHQAYVSVLATLAVTALLVTVLMLTLRRIVVRPLAHVCARLQDVAQGEGDLTKRLPDRGNDEIAALCASFNTFVTKLQSSIHSVGEGTKALSLSSGEIGSVATSLTTSASDTTHQAQLASTAANQVSNNVNNVAAATEELKKSIQEISSNIQAATEIARSAVQTADQANRVMGRLGDSSSAIGEIIKVIASIANKVNLLALNATIEAASAGEAGRSFAVVAAEVKNLARQTSEASETIAKTVKTIQTDVSDGVHIISDVATVIKKIDEVTQSIAAAIEEQSATTVEIGHNAANAAQSSRDIAETAKGVADVAGRTSLGADQSRATAADLARVAQELHAIVARFKT